MAIVSIMFRCCALSSVLATTPALAGPNVFWTFGFDRHYAQGTGGRAELPKSVRLAAVPRQREPVAAPEVVLAVQEPLATLGAIPHQDEGGANAIDGQ